MLRRSLRNDPTLTRAARASRVGVIRALPKTIERVGGVRVADWCLGLNRFVHGPQARAFSFCVCRRHLPCRTPIYRVRQASGSYPLICTIHKGAAPPRDRGVSSNRTLRARPEAYPQLGPDPCGCDGRQSTAVVADLGAADTAALRSHPHSHSPSASFRSESASPWSPSPRRADRSARSTRRPRSASPAGSRGHIDRGRERHQRQAGVQADRGTVLGEDRPPERSQVVEPFPAEKNRRARDRDRDSRADPPGLHPST